MKFPRKKPDIFAILIILVGLGVIVTTGAQEESSKTEPLSVEVPLVGR